MAVIGEKIGGKAGILFLEFLKVVSPQHAMNHHGADTTGGKQAPDSGRRQQTAEKNQAQEEKNRKTLVEQVHNTRDVLGQEKKQHKGTCQKYRHLKPGGGQTRNKPSPVLIAEVGEDGRLMLPAGNRFPEVDRLDVTEDQVRRSIAAPAPLPLVPWDAIPREANAAFVFDLIGAGGTTQE